MSIAALNALLDNAQSRARLAGRFWHRLIEVDGGCLLWPLSRNAKGYGRLTAGRGVHLRAHQVAYGLRFGGIPAGRSVLHRCDNPPCCNPDHLFLGSSCDNTQDMISKGRMKEPPHPSGEAHHKTTITKQTALSIISDRGAARDIADRHGLHVSTVYRLKQRKTWAQL